MATVELHLDGTRSAVMWHTPDDNPHASPPRVVIYADKVWQFYRFTQPRIPEHRAAWYRRVEPLRLAPGEYSPQSAADQGGDSIAEASPPCTDK